MLDFKSIQNVDPEVYGLIQKEYNRQNNHLEMIASENIPSEAVLQAQASYHTLKYAEGYPGERYYAGCENIDDTEILAMERVCELFNCKYANVQPHSGASANLAVQFAFCQPGDVIMGMSLNSGGHLTHGARPTISGKYFSSIQYEVDPNTFLIDYDKIKEMIFEYRPRLFIAGASAYPRIIDFIQIRNIINEYNRTIEKENACIFMVDMAHIAGLVAAGLHINPCRYADVVTSTTHKTLRGPRGGIILTNNKTIIEKINKAVFPGTQGGPLENIIAAKAVCFGEALKPEFIEYQKQVIMNAKTLAQALKDEGFKLVTDGTDNHLILLDLRDRDITGQELQERLESVGIITNKNAVPFDTKNKRETSGLRLGTPAITSRGMRQLEMIVIAKIIAKCAGSYDEFIESKIDLEYTVKGLAKTFPLYK